LFSKLTECLLDTCQPALLSHDEGDLCGEQAAVVRGATTPRPAARRGDARVVCRCRVVLEPSCAIPWLSLPHSRPPTAPSHATAFLSLPSPLLACSTGIGASSFSTLSHLPSRKSSTRAVGHGER